ncbi:MAG: hypothetical protein DLM58_24210 [Pseudonocardiales bacterium]|nr:MAG: hypothetical protein DLM58_24210 [Pseudonocardiales bacterium]
MTSTRETSPAAPRRGSVPARVARAGPALLHTLQRGAGNAAVARAVQRYSEPPGPAGVTPKSDPKFVALKGQLAGRSKALKAHPTGRSEAKRAADAAIAPGDDKDAQAKAAQAESMSGAKPAGFDKVGFIAAVKAAIAAQAPKNLDEADNFSESGKADAVKGQVAGKVTAGKNQSAQDITEKTTAAPDPSKAVEKPVTPLQPDKPPASGPVDASAGMPAKAPAEQTDFSAGKQETDQKMADAEVTEEQLAKSNEPEFAGALDAKKAGEQHSATAPGVVRESEAATLTATKQGAQASGKSGLAGMLQAKGGSLSKAATGKAAAKAKDEAARAQVTLGIKGIFDKTKTEVTTILGALDAEVAKRFDIGEKEARSAFTADHKMRMEKYKDARYDGLIGAARWTADLLTGLPAEANQIYLEAKKLYESKMERVISGVADFIGGELTRAKDRIAAGRNQIKDFVARQPKDLQKVANESAQQFSAQFDQLESDVDAKQDGLVDDLASKYVEARNSVDEEIKAAQDENKGWWDKAKDAIGGAIATVLKLKDMLLGVLARAAGAVGKIIKDPIGFLGNMVNAVKNGVMNFAANIVEHLKKGLQGWLLGSLAAAGIELPEKFDLKGIIKLVLSILGLTWTAIRGRIVRVIPESLMGKVEKGVAFIPMVLSEGIGGLWKWIAEKMSDLKEMVMGQIKDFVITKIIKAGITWIISLLNPAAAFIKACKMIYDVVMFFVEKAEQIKEFVDSILDSVESIASGGVGAVAGYIEKTLAKTLPVVLGFLASLLGLGGISEKIKDVLHTIQKPVMSVVDKLVAGAVKYGKKLMAGAKNLGKRALAKGKALGKKALGKLGLKRDDSPEGKKKRLDDGMRAALSAVNRFAGKPVTGAILKVSLAAIKLRFGMTSLDTVAKDDHWAVHGAVNPESTQDTDAKPSGVDQAKVDALRQWFGQSMLIHPVVAQISMTQDLCEKVLKAGSVEDVSSRLAKSRRYARTDEQSAGLASDRRIAAYGDRPRPGDAGYRPGHQWHHLEQQSALKANIVGYNPADDPTLDLTELEHRRTFGTQAEQRKQAGFAGSIGSAGAAGEASSIAQEGLASRPRPPAEKEALATKALLAHSAYMFSLTPLGNVGSAIDTHEAWVRDIQVLAAAAFAKAYALKQ